MCYILDVLSVLYNCVSFVLNFNLIYKYFIGSFSYAIFNVIILTFGKKSVVIKFSFYFFHLLSLSLFFFWIDNLL